MISEANHRIENIVRMVCADSTRAPVQILCWESLQVKASNNAEVASAAFQGRYRSLWDLLLALIILPSDRTIS